MEKITDRKFLKQRYSIANLTGQRASTTHPSRVGKGAGAASRGSFPGSRKGRR